MKPLLTYDPTNMFVGDVKLPRMANERAAAKKRVRHLSETGAQGWLTLPLDKKMIARVKKLAKEKRGFTTCLVIGIGGSDLGARAAYSALCPFGNGMELVFAGANTDPDELMSIVSCLDLNKTLINVISKSGDTIEPMATFCIVRELLIKHVGKKTYAKHIVATTGSSGSLHDLAEREGYAMLPVPENVGGRFSVLSDVGLFPLACAGIPIERILRGASQDLWEPAERFAELQYVSDVKRHQPIHVLMPYASRLKEFAFWYRQLWAESLGKEGKGPTPVAAIGATDQHSQIQLYNEGPNDKTVTFIKVEKFATSLRIPAAAKEIEPLSFLAGTSLQDVIHAELEGTASALANHQRPNATITIPAVTPETIGALFMFFEIATAVAGELYRVNTYNQPGVEEGKKATRALLTKNV